MMFGWKKYKRTPVEEERIRKVGEAKGEAMKKRMLVRLKKYKQKIHSIRPFPKRKGYWEELADAGKIYD